MRFLARFIDYIAVVIVAIPFAIILTAIIYPSIKSAFENNPLSGLIAAIVGYILLVLAIGVIHTFYKPIMESSNLQATLGKLAIGAKVTDEDGNKIGFGKAFYRLFLIELLPFILFILIIIALNFMDSPKFLQNLASNLLIIYPIAIGISIGNDNMKQGFHDRAAGTMVVRR